MTFATSRPTEVSIEDRRAPGSIVDWAAVLAGAVVATAISFVLLTFGSAIGFSISSAWPDSGASTRWVLSLAAFWILAQQIGAFLAGGYLAGRLRREPAPRTPQTEFRDGVQGGVVWAVGIALGAVLAASAAGMVARTGAEAVRTVTPRADQVAYFADVLLRPAAQPGQQPPAASEPVSEDTRAEMLRILARGVVNRELTQPDRAYLASLVAQRTGLGPEEAQRRVNDGFAQLEGAVRSTADDARRAAALGGFLTAAGLVIGFAAAWWGAIRGGHHRDENFTHSGFYLRPRAQG
ncbi:MAG: hypothetical protein NW223_03680 [Hyphomicrobiaceae bacterium]|nr:hypothetical protein [Hyphomicrobiaceae bacterium]